MGYHLKGVDYEYERLQKRKNRGKANRVGYCGRGCLCCNSFIFNLYRNNLGVNNMENLTFTEWLQAQYEPEELKDIGQHGCASCAPGGMIYYTETTDLYNRFADDLHDIVGECMEDYGDIPRYIYTNLNNAVMFRNAMVWFCAEVIAQRLTDFNED